MHRFVETAARTPEGGALLARVRASGLAEALIDVASCGSTNDLAREALEAGAARSIVVLAGTQTRGRGRRGARWADEPGRSVLMSAAWRAEGLALEDLPFLSLAAALAAARAAGDLGVAARVKWPNDVWVAGRKLAGVLVETSSRGPALETVVVGIGLNVLASPALGGSAAPAEARPVAVPPTSLAEAGWRRPVTAREVAGGICEHLGDLLQADRRPDRARVLEGFRALHAFAGRGALVTAGGATYDARSLEIGPAAELVLALADGTTVAITDSLASVRPSGPW